MVVPESVLVPPHPNVNQAVQEVESVLLYPKVKPIKITFSFFLHYDFINLNIEKGIDSADGYKKKLFFLSVEGCIAKKMEKSRIPFLFFLT